MNRQKMNPDLPCETDSHPAVRALRKELEAIPGRVDEVTKDAYARLARTVAENDKDRRSGQDRRSGDERRHEASASDPGR